MTQVTFICESERYVSVVADVVILSLQNGEDDNIYVHTTMFMCNENTVL